MSKKVRKRTAENTEIAVREFQKRTDDDKIELITSDEYKPYKTSILNCYGKQLFLLGLENPGVRRILIWNRLKI